MIRRPPRFLAGTLALAASLGAAAGLARHATAVVPGPDILHVPMAWCIVDGSPVDTAPSIMNEGGGTDTTTDAVIWRRHERPTDNIFLPQATISLRSAINDAWGTFNFPVIADPDTTRGQTGDVNGWNVNTDGNEFTTLINDCDTAYTNQGRAGIGVTAVNVGLFHDNANNAADGNTQFDYVTVIGWGGCNQTAAGVCVMPYDGRVMVIDNRYLYPTVADRTWPPSPADPAGTTQFSLTDPLDGLTGHETGHALSLPHRTDTTVLMNPSISDNNADGRADNIALDATEVTSLRTSAAVVPGLETDPPGKFVAGPVLAMRLVDGPRDRELEPYLDLASVKLTLDRRRNTAYVGTQLWGLLPCRRLQPTTYAALLDLDDNPATGASRAQLAQIGLRTRALGADLIARVVVTGGNKPGPDFRTCHATVRGWFANGKTLRPTGPRVVLAQIQTLRMYPHFAPVKGRKPPRDVVADVYNTIVTTIDNSALPLPIRPKRTLSIKALVVASGKPVDELGDGERGGQFILESPRFPHCFPRTTAKPGGRAVIDYDGLVPNREIHALLGPRLVLRGVSTNARGAGRIRLPIPRDTRRGLHLVTIGHDGLALTADCTVTIR